MGYFLYIGRRPQFRLLAKSIHKTVRTDTDRARCDWLLMIINVINDQILMGYKVDI